MDTKPKKLNSYNKSRSSKAIKNSSIIILNKTWMLVIAFSVRTIFIRLLGADYTGVSSLYTNILSVLSLAELGIGNISLFYLYEAISCKDEKRIYKITHKFKIIYRYIIGAILLLGISLIPFLRFIVKSDLNSNKLILYYLLFLVNTAVSYAYTYRKQVLTADQKHYIKNLCNNVIVTLMYVFQIVFLIFTRNYLIFLIIQIIFTYLDGFVCNYIVCKKYPYLTKKYNKKEDNISFPGIKNNLVMTFIGRISNVIISQTDSILISVIINTVTVGYYSNYYLLISYIANYFDVAATGIVGSFGNLQTEGNKEKSYKYFKILVTGFGLVATLCSVCFLCAIQDFVVLWIGKKYLLNIFFVTALVINFFVLIMITPIQLYKDTLGLFKKGQYARLIGAMINIILSIILGIKFGITGIIIATPISRLVTYFWYDGKILMDYYERKIQEYIMLMSKVFISSFCVVATGYYACKYIKHIGIIGIIFKISICIIIFCIVEYIVFRKSELAKWLLEKKKILKNKK